MSRGKATVNFKELTKFTKELENLADKTPDSFFSETAKALADEFIRLVKRKTPEGNYPDKIEFTTRAGKQVSFKNPLAGKQGGTLRKGWNIKSITKTAAGYDVTIFNPVEYASHVEYGHRLKGAGKKVIGWQPGKFMMTFTEAEIANLAPGIIEKKFLRFLQKNSEHL